MRESGYKEERTFQSLGKARDLCLILTDKQLVFVTNGCQRRGECVRLYTMCILPCRCKDGLLHSLKAPSKASFGKLTATNDSKK